jgi:hypothetical protein
MGMQLPRLRGSASANKTKCVRRDRSPGDSCLMTCVGGALAVLCLLSGVLSSVPMDYLLPRPLPSQNAKQTSKPAVRTKSAAPAPAPVPSVPADAPELLASLHLDIELKRVERELLNQLRTHVRFMLWNLSIYRLVFADSILLAQNKCITP